MQTLELVRGVVVNSDSKVKPAIAHILSSDSSLIGHCGRAIAGNVIYTFFTVWQSAKLSKFPGR